MKRLNTVFSGIVVLTMLASCKADMICPAYQSYFLLDSAAQANQFTYFAEDSFPRRDLFNSRKNKEGLMVYEEYRERWLDHKTVPMEVIYPVPDDSTLFAGDVMMYAETDVVDSAALDSIKMTAHTVQYNVDQKYYNWYFRDKLVWADEVNKDKRKNEAQPEPTKPKTETVPEEVEEDTTRSKFGLKGLFKKKEKAPREPRVKKEKVKKEPVPAEPVQQETPKEEDDGTDDF